jgi:hypothetical protein
VRLDEWKKFIDSQFLDDPPPPPAAASEPEKPAEEPLLAALAVVETSDGKTSVPPKEAGEETTRQEDTPTTMAVIQTPNSPSSEPAMPLSAEIATPTSALSATPVVAPPPTTPPHRPFLPPLAALEEEIPAFASYLSGERAQKVDSLPVTVEADSTPTEAEETPVGSDATPPADPEPPMPESNRALVKNRQKTTASPQRARHARNVRPEKVPSGLSAAELWAKVPRHVQTLLALERLENEPEVAQRSYKRAFSEKRRELIERLLDPILTLEETARLLNVCPTTVRRYTNRGILTYYRKEPDSSERKTETLQKETRQRRFRLSDILTFLETQQAAIEAERRATQPEQQPSVSASAGYDPGETTSATEEIREA